MPMGQSSNFYPQGNGLTKSMNKNLINILKRQQKIIKGTNIKKNVKFPMV